MVDPQRERNFTDYAYAELAKAGLAEAKLVDSRYVEEAFGDAEAVFQLGHILLRVERDRGQYFVALGFIPDPATFYQYDDVEIAMGWTTISAVLAKREPEDLESILRRMKGRLAELMDATAGVRVASTRKRLERAAAERGKAFTESLRHLN